MSTRERSTYIDITVAARLARVSPRTVRRYMQLGLIDSALTPDELVELRRVRRLTSLGVNLAGVEIILRMRRRIEQLQVEIERLQAMLDAASGRTQSE
jgi:MerR family transcriptional regulator/heat shock protein HspR